MKIRRYQDSTDLIRHACLNPDGGVTRIGGDGVGRHQIAVEKAKVRQLPVPLMTRAISCIGQHTEESVAPPPEFPVALMKNPAAVHQSGGPLAIPKHLESTGVDDECELGVTIGERSRSDAYRHAFGHRGGPQAAALSASRR